MFDVLVLLWFQEYPKRLCAFLVDFCFNQWVQTELQIANNKSASAFHSFTSFSKNQFHGPIFVEKKTSMEKKELTILIFSSIHPQYFPNCHGIEIKFDFPCVFLFRSSFGIFIFAVIWFTSLPNRNAMLIGTHSIREEMRLITLHAAYTRSF